MSVLMSACDSRHVIRCGSKAGDVCCEMASTGQCAWDAENMWCRRPYVCDMSTVRCVDVGACGFTNEPCCEGHCASQLVCSRRSRRCVDVLINTGDLL